VTDTVVIDSNLSTQSKESQSPKKRGRKKGATSYTKGDLTALLDSVAEILPITEVKWESVSQHFNETYALKFSRNTRTSVALKTKFRELVHGTSPGGGGRDEYEQRAKDIASIINKESGVISSETIILPSEEEDSVVHEKKEKPPKKRTRMGFENTITNYLMEFQKSSERHHNERMELFREYLKYKMDSKKE
jgi:hypothetical protein